MNIDIIPVLNIQMFDINNIFNQIYYRNNYMENVFNNYSYFNFLNNNQYINSDYFQNNNYFENYLDNKIVYDYYDLENMSIEVKEVKNPDYYDLENIIIEVKEIKNPDYYDLENIIIEVKEVKNHEFEKKYKLSNYYFDNFIDLQID